ncbi:MAG: 4-alpha-glucanotransferase [Rhodospirillales bacterium]|jgi:4-alpha-glucanotransferase|nr:4-alpha-glucanotransferase [Rhodospirillales bacterium]
MPNAELLNRLAELAGVVPTIWLQTGELFSIADQTKSDLLEAMGFDVSTDAAIADGIRRLEERPWRSRLDPVGVFRSNPNFSLRIPSRISGHEMDWRIELENGGILAGEFTPGELDIVETREIDGETLIRYAVALPDDLPWGYHRLTIDDGSTTLGKTTLIVAPPSSYLPKWMIEGRRKWGVACFLPSLRSAQNWGIGDFSDLADLADTACTLGAAAIGLNPQHALFTQLPEEASPYCPSSRTFLNVLNIDITAVDGFADCTEVQALWASEDFRNRLEKARDAELIDYTAVCQMKMTALRLIFQHFAKQTRNAAFDDFRREGGESLRRFALFETLHEHFAVRYWTDWPPSFHDPDTPDVAAFAKSHAHEIDFRIFAQCQAEQQFSSAAQRCQTLGLEIGLNRDLAVGCHLGGADSWTDPDLYVSTVRFGAPPDQFNSAGQNWGMAPVNPRHLRDLAFAPFIEMLQANMRHAGALRIDHVMALEQLFWIPQGNTDGAGAYVRYPFDDLLAIVALESHRNQCFVIGEDLGTVPSNFRERMADENILSYRVSQFERYPDGLYQRPSVYPEFALATANTHDLPTVRGHWQDVDIHLRHELEAEATPDHLSAQSESRAHDRELVRASLVDQGLIAEDFALDVTLDDAALQTLIIAVERFVARAPSRFMLAALTDLLADEKMLNLPGTIDEYPNWRHKIGLPTVNLEGDPMVRAIAAAISAERGTTSH